MAGMKFNADIDLEKIVKLRQEIDKLKKSLIEIASVPNSDAAVKQLESEIDRVTKKLSEYKDSYAKLQKIKYDIDSSNSTVKRVKEETFALRSTNKWIIANTESVKEADRQIKQLKKDFSALSDEEKVGDIGTAKIRQIQQLAAQRLVEEEAVRKTIKAQKDQIIQSNAEEGSITALRKQLILLIKDYDDLGRIRRGGDAGKALLTQISNVQKELNAAEQASGRFQRNVGNYASAWNGLGNSVQQVARELPSLAVNANTFFLAISNNLPVLVDEIAKVRKEYANFKAELKAGNKDVKAVAPVWQQLTKSILSWQTALVVGLTLLSVYGKDVIKWIGSLGKAKDVTLDLLSAEQEMALARKSAWSSIAKEQTQLDILYNKLKNVTLSTTERNAAVREWVKNYKTHSDILDGENVDLRKLENAYRALSKEIYANAVARAYADRIAELSVQREKEEMKRLNQKLTIAKAEQELERVTAEYNKKANEGFGTATAKLEAKDKIIQARKNVEDQKKIYNDLVNNVNDYDKNITVISNHIKTLDLFPQPKKGTYDYWKQQVEIADDALKQIQDSYLKVLKSGSIQGVPEEVVKQYDALIKQKTEAEEKLKIYDDKGLSKEYNSIVDQNQKISDLIDKQSIERKRREEDLENQVIQSRIDAMADGEAKIRAQRELGNKKEIQDLKRQREDYIRTEIEYQKRLFDAQEDLNAKKSKDYKKKTFDPSSVKVDTSNWDSIIENREKKQIKDLYTAEANAMREYLKEYGTFQQKKEAITKEYNDKIANATTEGDKKILQKQLEEALSSVDMDKLKQEINWELIFSDLNKVSKKSLEQVKQQLKTFKNSDEYKNMAVDQKKVIDEALNNIQSTIIDKGGLLGDLPEQLDALRIAQDELKQAQDEYNKSLKSGTDAEKEAALKKKNKAEKNVQNAETNVTRSADKTYQNLITLADTITQLGSSSEMSLSQIGSLASGLIDTFTEAGSKIGGIVGAVFSLLDGIEKQGFDGFVKNVFSSVFGVGASMWNTITFGGFNKLFGIGGNAKEVQDTIDRLTDRNETLQTAIEDLTDVMEASKGTKSVAAYTDAKKLQEETEENYKKIAQEQARYSNSHHSWNYYWGGFNQDEIARLSSQIGRNWNGDIWSLSPEEMKMLRSNVDMWEKIQNTGKGNYGGRLTEKLNDYIDQAGKMEELTNKLYEGLTGISFESMYDSFIDTLMDMDASAEDAADNIADYFMRAMLSNKIGELYSEKLKAWWEKFGKSMEDNELTESEREALQNEYMQYVEEAMKIRDEIAAATGYTGSSSSSSQETSKKGFATASQDSIDELNGRFIALQIAGEEIKNQNQQQTMSILELKADMLPIIANTSGIKDIASETRDLLRLSYEAIVDIRDNTNVIVKPIQQMASDIAEVKRNTNGLSRK